MVDKHRVPGINEIGEILVEMCSEGLDAMWTGSELELAGLDSHTLTKETALSKMHLQILWNT